MVPWWLLQWVVEWRLLSTSLSDAAHVGSIICNPVYCWTFSTQFLSTHDWIGLIWEQCFIFCSIKINFCVLEGCYFFPTTQRFVLHVNDTLFGKTPYINFILYKKNIYVTVSDHIAWWNNGVVMSNLTVSIQ